MFWFDKPKDELVQIPGTDLRVRDGIDFCIERWARKDYIRISAVLYPAGDGVVGQTRTGIWVLFRIHKDQDPTVREATPEEVGRLEHLPDGWEDHIAIDNFGFDE